MKRRTYSLLWCEAAVRLLHLWQQRPSRCVHCFLTRDHLDCQPEPSPQWAVRPGRPGQRLVAGLPGAAVADEPKPLVLAGSERWVWCGSAGLLLRHLRHLSLKGDKEQIAYCEF